MTNILFKNKKKKKSNEYTKIVYKNMCRLSSILCTK